MAQLKDLIVNGPSRFIGDVYATTFTGDLNGNANTATSATTAAALTGKTLVTASAVTTSNWPTYGNNHIPTMSFMAHWNGAYSGTSSNLAYCAQGTIIGSNNIGNQSVKYATTSGSCSGNAATATKATQDSDGNIIRDNYIRKDGNNGTAAGVSALINKLDAGSSTPTDADYYVCQYAGGGTTTTTYHRRPMSSMWNWIKAKTDTLYLTKSGSGATGTWGISISGNAATATTAITATKIGTSTVGSTTMPVYINLGTPTAITSFPEAYLSWGGLPIEGDISPIDAACCSDFDHNKLAFLPADCITVEYTTDGGSTWIDYGASDVQKISLVTSETAFYIGKGAASATNGTMTNSNCSNYQVRVTVSSINSSGTHKIYTNSKKLLINISSNGSSGNKIKMETQTIGDYYNNVDTWSTVGTYNVSGWSAWNSIPLYFSGGSFGGFNDQLYKVAKLRLTLSITGVVSSSSQASILGLRLIGTSSWINPSIMSKTGHLYSYDTSQNATFPGAITSTMFVKSGGTSAQFLKADGSVDSNTYSKTSHTHTSVLDVNGSSAITFAYSKAGLGYGDYTWLAGWNGCELRAISKSQFAQASHTHTKSQITDFPSSLPANGGNADTSNRAKFLETFQQNSTTTTYGSQYLIWAQWSDSANVKLKCTNYTVWTDKATYATTAGSAPASDVYAWAKASTKPTYNATEVKLSNYSKASSYSAIAASDTVNQAIGKLEGALSGLENLLASI